MRRLRISEHVSLDGVIQTADDDGGFAYGDWTAPYRTPAGRDALLAMQAERFDLLLGRRTYDIWSAFWPGAPAGAMADRLNAATKFVATHRPATLAWGPCEAIGPDLVADVRRIKAQDGPDLVLWGSSTLGSTLLGHGLVDELLLIVYPVLLGSGKRLVAPGTPARAFSLVRSQALPTGIVINLYAAEGPVRSG